MDLPASISDGATVGRLHWHPLVHRAWTGRQLYFWFFAFESVYSAGEVQQTLNGIFAELDITSYAVWELLGSWDLLARVYLEPSSEQRFSDEAIAGLSPLGLVKVQPFQVDDVIRHWVWADVGESSLVRPDSQTLHEHFPSTELATLNAGSDSPERRSLVQRYTQLGLVREASHSYGIAWVILIGASDVPDHHTRRLVGRRVAKVLNGALDLIQDWSLYEGRGGQRELFLIEGRIKHGDFYRLRTDLLEPLGEAAAIAGGRVTAFPVASAGALLIHDELALDFDASADPDVTAMLEGAESGLVEVFGTAFAPLDPWLRSGKDLEEVSSFPEKVVLKAIVALLNSGGGHLIVGAVEHDRYSGEARQRLSGHPVIGRYSIVGLIDPSYRDDGWDGWSHKLSHLIAAKIDRSPGVLVQMRQELLMGQDICIIRVDDPGDRAFYLRTSPDRSTYYARQGTEIALLQGSMIDEHRLHLRHRKAAWRPGTGLR